MRKSRVSGDCGGSDRRRTWLAHDWGNSGEPTITRHGYSRQLATLPEAQTEAQGLYADTTSYAPPPKVEYTEFQLDCVARPAVELPGAVPRLDHANQGLGTGDGCAVGRPCMLPHTTRKHGTHDGTMPPAP
jgi:hypothetical protein